MVDLFSAADLEYILPFGVQVSTLYFKLFHFFSMFVSISFPD